MENQDLKRKLQLFSDIMYVERQITNEIYSDDKDNNLEKNEFVKRFEKIKNRIENGYYSTTEKLRDEEFKEILLNVPLYELEEFDNLNYLSSGNSRNNSYINLITKTLSGSSLFNSLMRLSVFDQIYFDAFIQILKSGAKFNDIDSCTILLSQIYMSQKENKINIPINFTQLFINAFDNKEQVLELTKRILN